MSFSANPLSLSMPDCALEAWLRENLFLEILDDRTSAIAASTGGPFPGGDAPSLAGCDRRLPPHRQPLLEACSGGLRRGDAAMVLVVLQPRRVVVMAGVPFAGPDARPRERQALRPQLLHSRRPFPFLFLVRSPKIKSFFFFWVYNINMNFWVWIVIDFGVYDADTKCTSLY